MHHEPTCHPDTKSRDGGGGELKNLGNFIEYIVGVRKPGKLYQIDGSEAYRGQKSTGTWVIEATEFI